MKRSIVLIIFLSLTFVIGCDHGSIMKKFANPKDEAEARSYIDLLRNSKFDEIEKAIDPTIKVPNVRETNLKMHTLIPDQEPISIKVVGFQTHYSADYSTVNVTFEYQFSDRWLLANAALKRKDGVTTLVGLNVIPLQDSLENINAFTLANKSILHYLFLIITVFIALFSIYTLVLCIKTKPLPKKWLWIIFILIGAGKVGINWTSGEIFYMVLAVQLFSAAASAQLYNPWVISFSLPIGAIIFLIRRNQYKLVSHADSQKRGEEVEINTKPEV